jgi:asparagine N-glycosylation enzyme membrane subunit Stt3
MQLGGRGARRILFAAIALGCALRLSVWPRIFADGRVYIDGPDGYYHLRRAATTLAQWPLVPQFDPLLNYPAGGKISWPPLFDGLLATLALPWRTDRALEVIGAFLPPILGVLQLIVLYALVHSLRGRRAALAAVIIAAILPAVVRYTLLGTLDHDPFFTLCLLVSLWGLSIENAPLIAAGLTCGTLGWTGAIVQVAIVTLVALAIRRSAASRALAVGASAAAIIVLPFVITSAWRGATFEGLSWLHIAALAGAGLIAALLAGERVIVIITAIAVATLLPISLRPFLAGTAYAAGDAPILAMVAEAQPLLRLFHTFDLRPMLIRLGLLPILAVGFAVSWLRGLAVRKPRDLETSRPRDLLFITPWVVITLALALLHSRFSFDAGVALSAFGGIAFDRLPRRALIATIVFLPILPAYFPLPSLEAFNFYERPNALRDYEMDGICEWLRGRPAGAVLAPWSFGHWIVWIARKPVVISPMLSVGQSEFADGMRFFFLEDPAAARAFLTSHGVRYVIVSPEIDSIAPRARVAEIDPARYAQPQAYLRSIAARLTFLPATPGYREVMRSHAYIETAFGVVPLVRVYEVTK